RSDTLCFAPDGRHIARWSRDQHRVYIQSAPDGKITATMDTGRPYAISMAFTPDGGTLALGNMNRGSVELFDVASQRQIGQLPTRPGRLRALAISPDGRWLASAGHDPTIHLWDLASRHEVLQLHGHRAAIYSMSFSPDSQTLVSGGEDGTVR